MRSLFKASIWAPDAIPEDEWKYRGLKRVMFPAVDIIFFLAGISGVRHGIPAISEFFPDPTVDIFAYAMSVVALICLFGVAFPAQWRIEIFGKSILFGMMVGYFVALVVKTYSGADGSGFVLLVAAAATCPIIWRLSILGSEWQERRTQERQAEELRFEEQGE